MYKKECTLFHLAAFKCFDTVKLVAGAFIEASHVIIFLAAYAPPSIVERKAYIFIITVLITVGMTLWTATFRPFNFMQPIWTTDINALQEITDRAQCPDIVAEKQSKMIKEGPI